MLVIGHADLLAAQETQFLHIFRSSKTSKIKWEFNKLMVRFIDKDADELAPVPGDAFQEQRAFSTIAHFLLNRFNPKLNSTAKESVGVC